MLKVNKITESVPQDVTLEDGIYNGIWGGYVIQVSHKGKNYDLTTEVGVRGVGIKVVVIIKNGEATFEATKN